MVQHHWHKDELKKAATRKVATNVETVFSTTENCFFKQLFPAVHGVHIKILTPHFDNDYIVDHLLR